MLMQMPSVDNDSILYRYKETWANFSSLNNNECSGGNHVLRMHIHKMVLRVEVINMLELLSCVYRCEVVFKARKQTVAFRV